MQTSVDHSECFQTSGILGFWDSAQSQSSHVLHYTWKLAVSKILKRGMLCSHDAQSLKLNECQQTNLLPQIFYIKAIFFQKFLLHFSGVFWPLFL